MASSGINFTGISSGIDTASIVTALMQIEARPKTLVQQQQVVVNARTTALRDLNSKLTALKTASDALRSVTLFAGSPFAQSSDATKVAATATSAAAPGTYKVVVNRLATGEVRSQDTTQATATLGSIFAGPGTYASGTSLLTSLTDGTASGGALFSVGSTITLNATKGKGSDGTAGAAVTPATFTVTETSTVDDLRRFVQTSLPGASVTLEDGGKLKITSGAGVESTYSDVSLSNGGGPWASTESQTLVGTHNVVQANGRIALSSSGIEVRVDVTAGMTMADVAAAINGKNGTIQATVANGMLRLSSKQTGADAAITTLGDNTLDLGLSQLVAAQDADVKVNDVTVVPPPKSNTMTNGIPGVSVKLLTTTDTSGISLTVDPARVDTDAVKDKVKAFISAYNDTIGALQDRLTEKTVQNPKTDVDRGKGALFGDTALQGLMYSLRNAMQNPVGGLVAGQNLASNFGISTGAVGSAYSADLVSGKLTLDEAKLDQALAGGGDALEALFGSDGSSFDVDGLAQRVSDIAFGATRTGGSITSMIDGGTAQATAMTKRMDEMQASLDRREAALKAQFTAMETALANLKSMSNQMAGAMSGLFGGSTSS